MNIINTVIRKYLYNFFKDLLSDYEFKKLFKNKCNSVFEKKGKELGIWGHHKGNNLYGILDYHTTSFIIWCWRNTINTHPYCFHDLYYLYCEFTGNELDFNDKNKWEENLDLFFKFIEDNFELFFTTNIETKYFYHFWFRCNKSWTLGQITIIALMYKIREIFSEYKITKMEFALERGDINDFRGIDVILELDTKEKIKIQVKSGKIIHEDEKGCIVSGSANDLRANVDYYAYVDIDSEETEIVLFQNLNRYIERIGSNIFFKKDIIHPIRIKEKIMVSEKLYEIAKYCISNDILINIEYLKIGTNTVMINLEPEKVVNISISDFKDENLYKLLDDKFIQLKELFE